MDVVDITANTNETFVWAQDVTLWAQIYNLPTGVFRAQMRDPENDSLVYYEWSSANGGVSYSEAAAYGSIAFTANPSAGTTIGIGTQFVTFVSSGASGLEVNIGGNLTTTLASLLVILGASTDPQISLCDYAVSGATLWITAVTTGWQGNNIALSTTVAGATVSGATLAGGAHTIVLSAPLALTKAWSGPFIYDLRFEYGSQQFALLFGGSITWTEGVTRLAGDGVPTPNLVPSAAYMARQPSLYAALIFG
jgi:hypothetical protein